LSYLRTLIILCILILAITIISNAGTTVTYSPRIWHVDDDLQDYPEADFTSISDAVNAASSGDIIVVHPGTYEETIDINGKNLTIKGTNRDEVVVKGNITITAIQDSTINVTLYNFTIRNTEYGIRNNIAIPLTPGFTSTTSRTNSLGTTGFILNITSLKIKNTTFAVNITLIDAVMNAVVKDCIFENNTYGIYVYGEVSYIQNLEIIDNIFINTTNTPILVQGLRRGPQDYALSINNTLIEGNLFTWTPLTRNYNTYQSINDISITGVNVLGELLVKDNVFEWMSAENFGIILDDMLLKPTGLVKITGNFINATLAPLIRIGSSVHGGGEGVYIESAETPSYRVIISNNTLKTHITYTAEAIFLDTISLDPYKSLILISSNTIEPAFTDTTTSYYAIKVSDVNGGLIIRNNRIVDAYEYIRLNVQSNVYIKNNKLLTTKAYNTGQTAITLSSLILEDVVIENNSILLNSTAGTSYAIVLPSTLSNLTIRSNNITMECYKVIAITGSSTAINTNIVIENNKFNVSYTYYVPPLLSPSSRGIFVSRSPSPQEEMTIIYLVLDASNITLNIRDNVFRNIGENPLYHVLIKACPVNESVVRISNNEFYGLITESYIDYGVWLGFTEYEGEGAGLLGNSTVIVENNKFNNIISTIIAETYLANNTKIIVRNNNVNGGIGVVFSDVAYEDPLTINWGVIVENEVYNNVGYYGYNYLCYGIAPYNIGRKYWMLIRNITTINSIGVVYFEGAYGVWIEDCLFKNIIAPEGYGTATIIDVYNFTLVNCKFINCSTGLFLTIREEYGGNVVISNNLIRNCSIGVSLGEVTASLIIERNSIVDNDIGILVHDYNTSKLIFRLNTITGNDIGLSSEITTYLPIDVRLNWWGHWTGPYNETTNPEGLGDEIKGRAIYYPWLLNEPGKVPTYSFELISIGLYEVSLNTPDYKATIEINATQPLEVALTTYNVTPIQGAVTAGLKILGMGVDLWINNTNGAQWPIRVEFKLKKPTPEGVIPLLYYYNATLGRYTKCSNTGYNPATRTVWAYLTKEEYEAGIGTPLVPLGVPTMVGGKLLVEQTKTPDTLATILAAITLTTILTTLIARKKK